MIERFDFLYPDTARFAEIEKLLNFIKEGNSCQVVGIPGTGRSNILGLLTYNRNVRIKHLGDDQKNFHFVLLNFSEIRKRNLLVTLKFIFLGILDSLKERGMEKDYAVLNKVFKDSLKGQDELVFFQGLKKTIDYLAIEKNLHLILLFDRFEEYIPVLTGEFFADLRVLRNRAKYHFSVVFSLSRPLEDLLEPLLFSDFYEFVAGRIVYLPLYDKTGVDFRISYLKKITGKQIAKQTLDKIFESTGGHGNLARLCCEAILANAKETYRDNLEEFFLKQKFIRSALFGMWNSLTPSEQVFLNSNLNGILTKDIKEYPYLENIDLVKNGKIQIPLLTEYLKEKGIKPKENERIIYNESTNEILKGDKTLSDNLTSSEFKLLSFFLANKDAILDRDEIINAVWKENKTTEGVTNQALDQLIFRLRKKIEEDPNNPIHLQTVKGRGFKFAA
jgi:DNA-binding winged helix-turn-helix (wHTH) protein